MRPNERPLLDVDKATAQMSVRIRHWKQFGIELMQQSVVLWLMQVDVL